VSPAKAAELIMMPFRTLTWVGPRNRVLDGVQIPTLEVAILRAKRGWHRTCPNTSSGRYTQSNSAGGSTGMVQMMPIGVY